MAGIRKRTSKSVAKRHDLDYFKKGSPIRMWQWRLAAVAIVIAGIWIAVSASRSASAFSAGPISAPHEVFAQKCEVCHKPVIPGAGFLPVIGGKHRVPDSACLACHQVGGHHDNVVVAGKSCSSCHLEHIGAMHLASAPVKGCTQCHANLELKGGVPPTVAANIEGFTKGHPDFRLLRTASADMREAAFGLKFNHQEHLMKDLTGPNGTKTTLQCNACHQIEDDSAHRTATTGRMANVDFEKSCRSCHSLEFDKRVAEQAPHADAATVMKFVQAKMQQVAPGDGAALVKAEAIVFREKCALCHTVTGAQEMPRMVAASMEVPVVAPSKMPERFFTAAIFSHSAHGAVECAECHGAALTSTSGKDVLLPGIATCQKCHDGQSNPQGVLPSGHAESGCSTCHMYHEGGLAHGELTQPQFKIDELIPSR